MQTGTRPSSASAAATDVPRGETGIRILLTILFALVASVLRTVVAVIVIFELLWALISGTAPNSRTREFANRVIAYYYRVLRYLTYNEDEVPFPFSPFPDSIEPTGTPHDGTTPVQELIGGAGESGDRTG